MSQPPLAPARDHPAFGASCVAALGCLLGLAAARPATADSYAHQPLDALHYDVSLSFVPDFAYEAVVRVDLRLLADAITEVKFDLDGPRVDAVRLHGEQLTFRQEGAQLAIDLGRPRSKGEIVPLRIEYHGRPDGKGLRAGPNAQGHPTLFADNWPRNARRFIPSIDHPSDKATVDFTVTAEDRYDVIAPGRLVETRSLHDGRRTTRWSEGVPIPTYCMVIGLAEFQVTELSAADAIPQSAWVFPENAEVAARRLARAALVLERFSDLVAPFPYEKLAHVESSTAFGAVEYASAIFYSEKTFQEPGGSDGVVAHEAAHQWWGDSVTPADWDDVWLSEGFATYFQALFVEGLEGPRAFREQMSRQATAVREANAKQPRAIVEPEVEDPAAKLSAFTYQKGAWVLHMLRRKLGDEAFFRGLRGYYATHAAGNATTADLRHALEAASGLALDGFFQQWLYRPGLPQLRVAWRWDGAAREVVVDVEQTQPGAPYALDVDLGFRLPESIEQRTVKLTTGRESLRLALPAAPQSVEVDPDGWLLHAATVVHR
jgi:aminopeptidase N